MTPQVRWESMVFTWERAVNAIRAPCQGGKYNVVLKGSNQYGSLVNALWHHLPESYPRHQIKHELPQHSEIHFYFYWSLSGSERNSCARPLQNGCIKYEQKPLESLQITLCAPWSQMLNSKLTKANTIDPHHHTDSPCLAPKSLQWSPG